MIKKFFAVLLAAVLVCCGVSGCMSKPDTRAAYTINGREFSAGEFLMYQLNSYELISSYMDATFSRTDETTGTFYDMKTQMGWIVSPPYGDGEEVRMWIAAKTLDSMKLAVYFENAMEQYGLTVTEEDRREADELSNYLYSNGEQEFDKYYTRNGISLASMKKWLYDRYNQQTVFNYLYGEGGEREVSQQDLIDRFTNDYGYYKIIQIPYYNLSTGEIYSDEEIAAIELFITDSIAAVNKGEMTMDQVQAQLMAVGGTATQEELDKAVAPTEFSKLEDSIYTGNFVTTYQGLKVGQAGYDKDANYGFYFVFQKMDPMAEGLTYFEDNKTNVLASVASAEYLEQCLAETDAYTVDYDSDVITYYAPVKIKPELTASSQA